MKTIFTALVAFGLLTGAAAARVNDGYFTNLERTAPKSSFDGLQDSAPRSVFDDIQATAPRSIFDQIGATAPRAGKVQGIAGQDFAGE